MDASAPNASTGPVARPSIAGGGRLGFVEAGRGLSALAVVLFHANVSASAFDGPVWRWPSALQHGVDFFFVLSGFIILHAHCRDVGVPGSVPRYLLKRAIRLLPLLWMVVIGWAVLRLATGASMDGWTLFRSVIPYPSLEPTMPSVVWTLRHEIVFYLFFTMLLVSKRIGLILLAAWLVLIFGQFVAVAVGQSAEGLPAFFLSGFAVDFMLGMAAAKVVERYPAPPSAMVFALSLFALTIVLCSLNWLGLGRIATNDYVSPGATYGTVLLGLVFAGIVVGLVRMEGVFTVSPVLARLGAASYALYLVHTVVNALAQRYVALLPSALKSVGIGHAVLIIAGVAAGFALHYGYERPVTGWLRRKLLSGNSSASLKHTFEETTN